MTTATAAGVGRFASPSWSPDDTATPVDETDQFLLSETRRSRGGRTIWDVRRINIATGEEKILASTNTAYLWGPDWRPFPSSGWAPATGATVASASSLTTAATSSGGTGSLLVLPAGQLDGTAFDTATLGGSQPADPGLTPHQQPRTAVEQVSSRTPQAPPQLGQPWASPASPDLIDQALTDFDTGLLDDALLEDLAVALAG